MKKMIVVILALFAIVLILGCYQIAGLNKEITELKQKIAVEQERYVEYTEGLKQLEKNMVDTTTTWKNEEARKWLLNPEKGTFEKMVELLNPYMTRDQVFKWYLDCSVLEDYMVYISSSGVRKYKASRVRNNLRSPQDDWWLQNLYKSPEHSDINSVSFIATANIEIPSQLLTSKIEFEYFLTTMEGVFPKK